MMLSRMQLLAMISSIIFLRLLFVFVMGPMPQDAYYFFYSQHPALSYFDHPPMVALMLKAFSFLFGNNTIAIKIADFCTTSLSIILFYNLARCFLGERQLKKAMLLLISTLMVAILSLVSTPDVPLMLFWTLSLLFLYHAVFKRIPTYWLWSGIAMGLAFDSKYTAVFLPAGLVLFLLLSKPYRHFLLSKWFWLAVVSFFVVVLPVIIWNVQHNFASFKFQGSSRMNPSTGLHLQLKYFFGLLGHQSLILTPVLFGVLGYLVFRMLRKYRFNLSKMAPEHLFLMCFFLPLATTFGVLSFVCYIKLNWLMPAYLTAIIWVSIHISRRWVAYQVLLSTIVHFLLSIEIIFYPVPVRSDDTWYGWKDLSKQVATVKRLHPSAFVFAADGYKTSAELNLLMPGFTYSQNIIGENALEFDYVNSDLSGLQGKDAIFLDSEPRFKDEKKGNSPPASLHRYFKTISELDPILIKANNRTVRKFLVYYCTKYTGPQNGL